jgi:biopolymer transport protein TolQ
VTNLFLTADATTLSPVALFLQADWVVKFVMAGLLCASVWTWAIIFSFGMRIGGNRRKIERFERDFWKAEDIDAFHRIQGEC